MPQRIVSSAPMHPGYENGASLYYLPPFASSIGNLAITTGTIYYTYFYVPAPIIITALSLVVSTGSAGVKIRQGIYRISAGNPTDLIVDASEITATTTGTKDAAVSLLLPPAWYALASTPDSNGVSVNATQASTGQGGAFSVGVATISTTQPAGKRANFTYGVLPASAPTSGIASNVTVPLICLKT